MLAKEIIELYEILDQPGEVGHLVRQLYTETGINPTLETVTEGTGSTEFISFTIPGIHGKQSGGNAPTLGVIGRLGAIGARPARVGFVSDGDGALAALSVGLRLARMAARGDRFVGDVSVMTHLCTQAPIDNRSPVAFMGLPVSMHTMTEHEVDRRADAIISMDTSRGNRIINHNGFAITPTVKEGWILRVSEDLLTLMEQVTGTVAAVVPITMQDITPYENGLHHFNSLMQPATMTSSPVVGVAFTSQLPVPGSATGVSSLGVLDAACRFVVEVAQLFTRGSLSFYDKKEYEQMIGMYGDMKRLQG